jgi:hypothetical protein
MLFAQLYQRFDMVVCNVVHRELALFFDPHKVKLPQCSETV